MFSNEFLENVLSRKDVRTVPLVYQTLMLSAIEEELANVYPEFQPDRFSPSDEENVD